MQLQTTGRMLSSPNTSKKILVKQARFLHGMLEEEDILGMAILEVVKVLHTRHISFTIEG